MMVIIVVIIFGVMSVMAMVVMSLTEALFTVEHQEIHSEWIEGCDEHTRHHRKESKVRASDGALSDSLNDWIFRIETWEERCTNQSQWTQ